MPRSPVDRADLLRLLDQHRRTTVIPGYRLETTPETTRYVDDSGVHSFVLHSLLGPGDVDRIIARETGHFGKLGHAFEWKVFDHDQPPDLRRRLEERGFEIEPPEAVLVLELAEAPAALLAPPGSEVRTISHPGALQDVLEVWKRVWPDEDQTHWVEKIAQTMRERPASVSVFVAYVDGMPAATGRIAFSPGDPFAYLAGGATLPEYRGRGLYTDVLRARVQEAISRGVRLLMVDARPMSRPILERHGFRFLGHAHACMWKAGPTNSPSPRSG